MMTITDFATEIALRSNEWLPKAYANYDVTVGEVSKPGRILTAISWHGKNDPLSPAYYVDNDYDLYLEGTLTIDDAVKKLANSTIWLQPRPQIVDEILDWEWARTKLTTRILNRNNSKNYTKDLVSFPVGDTACIMICDVLLQDGSNGRVPVTRQLASSWGVSDEELRVEACENAPKIAPPVISSLSSMLGEMCAEASLPAPDEDDKPMLIITNDSKICGAGVVTYPGVPERVADIFGEEAYFLPSSVHETIAIPQSYADPGELLQMVTEINKTQVRAEDYLADDVWEIRDGSIVSVVKPATSKVTALQQGDACYG